MARVQNGGGRRTAAARFSLKTLGISHTICQDNGQLITDLLLFFFKNIFVHVHLRFQRHDTNKDGLFKPKRIPLNLLLHYNLFYLAYKCIVIVMS